MAAYYNGDRGTYIIIIMIIYFIPRTCVFRVYVRTYMYMYIRARAHVILFDAL